jgi:hypothetical protein
MYPHSSQNEVAEFPVSNPELTLAWEYVEHTGRSLFLTGKAGTGKTTFLKNVVEKTSKRIVVVAPTGVAAINAGGTTIHSFFQLPLTPFVPEAKIPVKYVIRKEKRNLLASLDLLVIDEISMVRADLLDAIDSVLRRYRNRHLPFGGVQLLMIGDLGQLTPVVTPEDEQMLASYYDSPYFFSSKALQQIDYLTVQLENVYRQQDTAFLEVLNRIRENRFSAIDMQLLNQRYVPSFEPSSAEGFIRLTTHNHLADSYNRNKLQGIDSPSYYYQACIEGTFPEYSYPTSETLELKVGAQVMFVKNDPSGAHLYYNGRIGLVVSADEKRVQVLCPGDSETIEVEPQEWENNHYRLNPETHEIETEVQGVFRQLPLRLAWAITIHKSQGLTFDHAIIDAGLSFAPGQVYVALSRCRTLDGIVLATPIEPKAIRNDIRVERYVDSQEQEICRSASSLQAYKDEYYATMLHELFDFRRLLSAIGRMLRLMEEYFYHSHPELLQTFRNLNAAFLEKVISVSEKWVAQMRMHQISQLKSPDFQQRLSRSCAYFRQQLVDLFSEPLQQMQHVDTKNKQVLKRYAELQAELRQHHLFSCLMQERFSLESFSVPGYLKARMQSYFESVGEDAKTSKRKKKEKAPKEPKAKTWELSYNLFKQGLSAEEIARERSLTVNTVYGHLARYVTTGELSLSDILPAQKHSAILDAIERIGTEKGLTALKEICPPDISYAEIRLVIDVLFA